ncbi:MAG: hypothetical protein JXA71_13735 [Chitinispirillaceae bacterium]|nr:hypothetical protein [Chitinispirillaceae bacterium]
MKRTLVVAIAALFVFCKGTNGPEDGASSVRYVWELHLPGDSVATGWEEDGTRYKIYDGAILMNQMIDGGAPKFIDQGLVAGIYQVMLFDTLYDCIIFVMDFGSADKAKGMLDKMKVEVQGMPLAISGFDTTVAAATPALGGNSGLLNRF